MDFWEFIIFTWADGCMESQISMTVGALTLIGIGSKVVGFTVLGIDIIHTLIVSILLLTGSYKDGNGDVITYPGQTIKIN